MGSVKGGYGSEAIARDASGAGRVAVVEFVERKHLAGYYAGLIESALKAQPWGGP